MEYVVDRELFKEVEAHLCAIEFQEHNLTHTHHSIFRGESAEVSISQPKAVVSIISAKIPTFNSQSLPKVILKQSRHNPYCI